MDIDRVKDNPGFDQPVFFGIESTEQAIGNAGIDLIVAYCFHYITEIGQVNTLVLYRKVFCQFAKATVMNVMFHHANALAIEIQQGMDLCIRPDINHAPVTDQRGFCIAIFLRPFFRVGHQADNIDTVFFNIL